jgi:hypothetical protein
MSEIKLSPRPEERTLIFSDGSVSGGLLVTRVDTNLYRMEEGTLFHEVLYHEIVGVERKEDGSLRIRVAKPSGFVTATWMGTERVHRSALRSSAAEKSDGSWRELGANLWRVSCGLSPSLGGSVHTPGDWCCGEAPQSQCNKSRPYLYRIAGIGYRNLPSNTSPNNPTISP